MKGFSGIFTNWAWWAVAIFTFLAYFFGWFSWTARLLIAVALGYFTYNAYRNANRLPDVKPNI